MHSLKYINSFLTLCWLLIILLIGILTTAFLDGREIVASEEKQVQETPFSNPEIAKKYSAIQQGKTLFKRNCASCHNKNMKDHLVGPALDGVLDRWSDFPKEDLYQWIRNSQSLIKQKHPRALSLWKEWNQSTMNNFPNLTNEDIDFLIAYIEFGNQTLI